MCPKRRPRGSSGPIAPSSPAPSHAAWTSRDRGRRSGRGEGPRPAHAGMVGGPGDRPVTAPDPESAGELVGKLAACRPSHRTAVPAPRRPGASTLRAADRPPPVPAALRARCGRARQPGGSIDHTQREEAAGARPRTTSGAETPSVQQTTLAERRGGADRALADRGEQQTGHAQLDLQPSPARPRARGLRQPRRARLQATTSRCSSTRRLRPSRPRCTAWATTRVTAAGCLCRPTSWPPRPNPHPRCRRRGRSAARGSPP